MRAITEADSKQVYIIVSKMRISHSLVEDARQVGYVGMLQAAARFDPECGLKFSTFAEWRIRGAIQDWLRCEDCLTRSQRKAVQGGIDPPLILTPLTRAVRVPGRVAGIEERIDAERAGRWLMIAIDALPERNRTVVQKRLQGMGFSAIGRAIGVSTSRAWQLMTEAVGMLRGTA